MIKLINKKYMAFIFSFALASLVGCGTEDDDKGGTTSTASFSTQFKTSCALSACHGSTGTNGPKTNLSTYTKQSAVTVEVFKSVIRNGKGAMPKFSTTVYSDADLEADFAYFSAL